MRADLLVDNIGLLLTMEGEGLGPVPGAAVAISEGRVVAAGPREEVLGKVDPPYELLDAGGRLVSPGLVDPHTHLVYAGGRAWELAERLRGAKYMEILARGGGILSTVRATRRASFEELVELAEERLIQMLRWGVTTVEVKTGYGLSPEEEMRLLDVIEELGRRGHRVISTFLMAHAFPPEVSREDYLAMILETLPRAAPKAAFCDVFMDEGVFTPEEARLILERARELGMGLKLHADELAPTGGAELAADLGAVSADHLIRSSPDGIGKMARAGVVGVVLPGTSFFLREPYAPVATMREKGLEVALATDHNPGTSPTLSLLMVARLAVFGAGMTVEEAWLGMTRSAARALAREDLGAVRPGAAGDLVIWDLAEPVELFYRWDSNPVRTVVRDGVVVAP